jgi:hypothetical protein
VITPQKITGKSLHLKELCCTNNLLFLNILEALNIPTIQHAEDFVSGSSPPLEITKKEKAYEKKKKNIVYS